MYILSKDDLPIGGFAGIVEQQLVINQQVWPGFSGRTQASNGLGSFVYLSTGYFKPNEGAPMHPHDNVDIVTLITSGKVGHQGTLGNGLEVEGPAALVQRAGSGMQHQEMNITDRPAEFVQLWFLAPSKNLPPEYQLYPLGVSGLTTVLGGEQQTLSNHMTVKIGQVLADTKITQSGEYMLYLAKGEASISGHKIKQGDLVQGKALDLITHTEATVILIYYSEN